MNDPHTPSVDVDFANRPGVPMEKSPGPLKGVHWTRPDRQPPNPEITRRVELKNLPPVFGTAQPPSGLSGAIRRSAYGISENLVRHWMLLLLADRVDVLERRLGKLGRTGALGLAAIFAGFVAIRALKA